MAHNPYTKLKEYCLDVQEHEPDKKHFEGNYVQLVVFETRGANVKFKYVAVIHSILAEYLHTEASSCHDNYEDK